MRPDCTIDVRRAVRLAPQEESRTSYHLRRIVMQAFSIDARHGLLTYAKIAGPRISGAGGTLSGMTGVGGGMPCEPIA